MDEGRARIIKVGLVVDRKSGTTFHCHKSSWTLKFGAMSAAFSVNREVGLLFLTLANRLFC
jgi:hypothetical protein